MKLEKLGKSRSSEMMMGYGEVRWRCQGSFDRGLKCLRTEQIQKEKNAELKRTGVAGKESTEREFLFRPARK